MDKALDNDATKNHAFLASQEKLLKIKEQTPRLRFSSVNNPLRETVTVTEMERKGIRGPKKSFLELSVYEKKHGPAPPAKIKSIKYQGKWIKGVDVVDEQDVSCVQGLGLRWPYQILLKFRFYLTFHVFFDRIVC